LGDAAEIVTLEIETYGQVWGSLFPKHTIPLEMVKQSSAGRDIQIIIETCAWGYVGRSKRVLSKA
jgi:hypothetical protein